MWPAERPFVVLAPQHAFPQENAQYAPCDAVEHGGSCALTIQHELGHPENGSIVHDPSGDSRLSVVRDRQLRRRS